MYRVLTSSVASITSSGICVFSIKLIKSVVSLRYDSCLAAIGCKSESTKLEMRSVGPLLPETIGLPTGVFFVNFSQRIELWYSRLFEICC